MEASAGANAVNSAADEEGGTDPPLESSSSVGSESMANADSLQGSTSSSVPGGMGSSLTSPAANPTRRRGRRSSLTAGSLTVSSYHGQVPNTPTSTARTLKHAVSSSSMQGRFSRTPTSSAETPNRPISASSGHRRLSTKLTELFQKFEEPTVSPMYSEPLMATGRRLSINAGLQNRVEAFSPGKIPMTRQILLTPREVNQLVLSSTTTNRLLGIKSHMEQSVDLQKKKLMREKQRKLLSEFSTEGRRKEWEATRAQFEKPVKYHGAGQFLPSQKIQVELSIDLSTFEAPSYGPKTGGQRQRILDVVERNFVFSEFRSDGNARTHESMEALINAFEVKNLLMGHVLWDAGDAGEQQAFYLVDKGTITFHDNDKHIASANAGDSLGEQSLIHTAISTITVSVDQGTDGATVLKLEPRVYRGLLQMYSNKSEEEKRQALRNSGFLKHEDDEELLRQLASIMTRVEFSQSEKLYLPENNVFFLVQSGSIRVLDTELQAGDCFGERLLLESLTSQSTVARDTIITGLIPGVFFKIERERLDAMFGLSRLQSWKDVNRLINFYPFNRTKHSAQSKRKLARNMTEEKLTEQNPAFKVGKNDEPTIYVVREGTVTVQYNGNRKDEVKETGAVFGHDLLQETVTNGKTRFLRSTGFSATIHGDVDAVLGLLPVQDHENVLHGPETIPRGSMKGGLDKGSSQSTSNDGALELRGKIRKVVESEMDLADFERIKLLGEGMFGEVWLVAADIFKTGQVKQKFALKSQRKVDDTRGKDALSSILREVKAMKELDHPQIVDLVHTFEDEENVYMLMGLIPGGELWDRIYQELPSGEWSSGLSEGDAKFYMFTIADTLSFIHSKTYVYRDLKPENIMLDSSGYPVLVDFGFAKFVEDKTYTFCGTPNYCAPEIILNAGHNRGVDLWALGVTLYEIITGENPFYFEGMDTLTLYDAICRDPPFQLKTSDGRSDNLISLVDRLLEKDPTKRLGMLSGGMRDVLDHAWFEGLDTLRVKSKRWPAPWKPESDQDKRTQEMIESSMTASVADGLPFTPLHESGGSLSFSFHEDPIAEEETDSQVLNDSKESFFAEDLNDGSSSFREESIVEEALHGSADSIQDTDITEEESGGVSPKVKSAGIPPFTSPHAGVSSGSPGDNSGSPRSGKETKEKSLLLVKKISSPRTDSGSRPSIYLYPIAKPPKKKDVDVAKSKSRRSTISGALAGLGISGSDDEDVL